MTDQEAIAELRRRAYRTTCYGNKVLEHEENLVAIRALEKQIPKPPEPWHGILRCASCGVVHIYFDKYCPTCGQRLE